jgi:hypothetical protein
MRAYEFIVELRKNERFHQKKTGTRQAIDFIKTIPESDRENWFVSVSTIAKLGINPGPKRATDWNNPLGVYAISAEEFYRTKSKNPDFVDWDGQWDYDYKNPTSLGFGEGFKYIYVFRVDPKNYFHLEEATAYDLKQLYRSLQKKYPEYQDDFEKIEKVEGFPYNGEKLYWRIIKLADIIYTTGEETSVYLNKIFRNLGIKAIYSSRGGIMTGHGDNHYISEFVALDIRVIEHRKLFVNAPEHIPQTRGFAGLDLDYLGIPHIRSVNPIMALGKVLKANRKLSGAETAIFRLPAVAITYVEKFLKPKKLKWDSAEYNERYPVNRDYREDKQLIDRVLELIDDEDFQKDYRQAKTGKF